MQQRFILLNLVLILAILKIMATWSYQHPKSGEMRTVENGVIDIGAYEYGVALPISLVSLTALATELYNKVIWTKQSEINNTGFGILKSEDGKNFKKIGWQNRQGNSNEINQYHYDDKSPFYGINYYQLAHRDIDKSVNRSKIVSVLRTERFISLYQNPALESIYLRGVDDLINFEITDNWGNTVSQGNMFGQSIDIESVPAGNYYLRLLLDGEFTTKQFSKIE